MGSTDPKGEGPDRPWDSKRTKMPGASDVERIPEPVRAHALVMLQLDATTREARKRWNKVRDAFKGDVVAGNLPIAASRAAGVAEYPFPGERDYNATVQTTLALWRAELAQEVGAAVYREQLAENNARPVGERWSPTVLALWARCSIAGQKPA